MHESQHDFFVELDKLILKSERKNEKERVTQQAWATQTLHTPNKDLALAPGKYPLRPWNILPDKSVFLRLVVSGRALLPLPHKFIPTM